jgi:phospholipid/cholesterol/gamma-HCH transport system substrate-binding protein
VSRRDDPFPSINLDLRAGFDPPVCTTGFPDANNFRDPNDKTVVPVDSDTYCKVAKNSPLVVRGARNAPCPNSDKRGPYAFSCGLVFDRIQVDRQKTLIAAGDKGTSSGGAELITPGGSFFLDALSGGSGVSSLQDLLMGGTGR